MEKLKTFIMPQLEQWFCSLLLFSLLLFSSELFASNSLSYSGRLVNADGSPVTGSVNLKVDLAYTNNTTTILCTQSFTGVSLTNGVFHLKLDLVCTPNPFEYVLENIPVGESIAIRVSDETNLKTYSFQALHSMPMAKMSETSKKLVQMGATDGQVLTWDAGVWKPMTPAGTVSDGSITTAKIADGAVTDAKVSTGIGRGKLATGTANYVLVNDGSGFMSEVPQLGLLQGGTGASTASGARANLGVIIGTTAGQFMGADSVPTCAANEKLTMTVVIADYLWDCIPVNDDTKLPLTGGQMTGAIDMFTNRILDVGTPSLPGDAANKAYVDAEVAGVNGSQWTTVGSDIHFDTGNVGLGTSTPSQKLDIVGSAALSGNLKLQSDTAYYTDLKAPIGLASNLIFTLPNSYGTSGYTLTTDGAGNLSWSSPSVGSGGITDGSIVDADVSASAGIAQSKIAGLTTDLLGKEPTIAGGTADQYWKGDKSWGGFEADVRGTDLLGLNTTAGSVTATDTVLSSIGKIVGNVSAVSSAQSNYVLKAGDTMSGALAMGGNQITNLAAPTLSTDAATMGYVDAEIGALTSSQWTTTGSDIYYNSGNIGIGTAAPQNKMHINDSGVNSVVLQFTNADTGQVDNLAGGRVGLTSDEFMAIVSGTNGNGLKFFTNNTNRMTIDTLGNVGIGTATPANKLDVSGNIALTGNLRLKSDNANYVELKAPAALASSLIFNLPGSLGTSGQALVTDGAGALSWSSVATTSSSVGGDLSGTITTAEIKAGVVGTVEIADGSIVDADVSTTAAIAQTKIANLTTDLAAKEATIVAGTTTQYWSGNKTWQELTTTAVTEGTRLYFTEPRVRSTPLTGYAVGTAIPLAATDTLMEGLGKLEAQIIANDTAFDNTGQWSKNASNIYFNLGYVGIGTTNPSSNLHVNGAGAFENSIVGSGGPNLSFWKHRNYGATANGDELGYLSFYGHDGAALQRSAFIISRAEGAPAAGSVPGNLTFNTTSTGGTDSTEKMRITADGNVGIGTTSPSKTLDISKSDEHTQISITNNSSTTDRYPGLLINNYYGTGNGLPVIMMGNIGGSSGGPTATGTERYIGSIIGSGYTGSSWPQAARMDFVTESTFTSTSAPAYIKFSTTSTNQTALSEKMRVTADGNVGIGTATPGKKLVIAADAGNGSSTFGGGKSLLQLQGTNANFSEPSIEFVEQTNAPIASVSAKNLSGGAGDMILSTRKIGDPALTEKVRITDAGNVGIGTTAPSAKLEVQGSVKATSFVGPGILKAFNQVVADTLVSNTTSTWADVPGMSMTLTTGNSKLFITASGMYRNMNGSQGNLRLVIDGVAKIGVYTNSAPSSGTNHESISLTWLESVTAGSHTIKLQWQNATGVGSFDQGWADERVLKRVLQVAEHSE